MDLEKLASIFDAVNVATIKPGDALVVRCYGRLDYETSNRIEKAVKKKIPSEITVIVLDEGADISILRKE